MIKKWLYPYNILFIFMDGNLVYLFFGFFSFLKFCHLFFLNFAQKVRQFVGKNKANMKKMSRSNSFHFFCSFLHILYFLFSIWFKLVHSGWSFFLQFYIFFISESIGDWFTEQVQNCSYLLNQNTSTAW